MATSVPVPIARPRSAWASAGASLTPSPTMATTRPSACRRRTTSALSAGRTSAMTSSMPTSAATARAVVSLSPVSSTGRRPERLQRRDRLGRGRLDGVGDDEHARGPRRPSRGDRRRCGPAPRRRPGGVELGGGCAGSTRPAARGGRRPTPWPSTTPSTPRPSRLAKPSTAGSGAELVARRGRSPGRSGARRRPRARRRAAAPRRGRAVGDDDVDEAHPAGGDGAGLVEHDRVDPAGGLEDLRALDQQAELGAAAGADQQRGRRGEPERARAGDDQHGDGGGERERRRSRRRRARSRAWRARADDDRDEDAGDAVGEPLDRRLAGLRVGDEPGDLGERGVGADLGGAHDEAAAGVDGRARDLVARADFSTGTDSPVSSDWSTALVPSSTMPSVATFSPGRTTKRSPTASCSTGTRRSVPSASRTATSLAPSSSSAFSAAPARRLARASK